MTSRHYRLVNLFAAAGVVAVMVALSLVHLTPDEGGLVLFGKWSIPELCLVKRTTGRTCPSCGIGRSLVLAAHGLAKQSLQHHTGGMLMLAWLLAQGLWRLVAVLFARRLAKWAAADLFANAGLMLAVFSAVVYLGNW